MQCAYSLQLCIEMHYTEGNRAVISCTKKDSVVFEKLGTELKKKKSTEIESCKYKGNTVKSGENIYLLVDVRGYQSS